MKEITGRFNSAIAYTNELEAAAEEQIRLLCDQSFVEGSKIRIMPDVHVGMGCTIGTTMTLTNKIVPNLVGVDIGCGIEVVKLQEKEIDCAKLDKAIRRMIPSGFEIRKTPHPYIAEARIEKLRCAHVVNLERARLSVGTLGGGNHFIEINRDDEGNLYIVVHSGSRHMGHQIAEHYQKTGHEKLNKSPRKGRGKENDAQEPVPRALAYVEGQTFKDYLHDMALAQHFATLNRKAIAQQILEYMQLTVIERFTTIHNYIDIGEGKASSNMILRKGAVSARAGEKLLIPMNMRDGSLICVGKGNPEWNFSAPHGAGRLMSRTVAKSRISMEDYRKSMDGIFSTTVERKTLDEAPMAYKSMESIIPQMGDTVTVERHIIPIYNFKAAE